MARRCRIFNNWIENCELIEIAFTGPSHTWARGNSIETRQSARLDRALCSANWSINFDKATVDHRPAIQSDYCPLLIAPNGFAPVEAIARQFKFQAVWMVHENFQTFLNHNWPTTGDFPSRLAILSNRLQVWNDTEFGDIFKRKNALLKRIKGCQKKKSEVRDGGTLKMLNKFRKELDEILDQEELLWYQKSRLDFIKDGDRNTKFFQVSTLIRRWKNKIATLKNKEGIWIRDTAEVKQLVLDYYKTLFTEEEPDSFSNSIDEFPELAFQDLHPSDFATLARPYTDPEIAATLWSMNEMKAPGPDGFQALFYKKKLGFSGELLSPHGYQRVGGKRNA